LNKIRFIIQTIRFYKRQHLAVLAGIILSTAIITGALVIGDSIKFSLRKITEARLGNIQYVLQSNDRFVRASLGEELASELYVSTASVLLLEGVAGNPEKELQINRSQVVGIDSSFWKLNGLQMPVINTDEAIISEHTAEKLNLKVHDDIVLRIEKISVIPVNSPFSVSEAPSESFRLKIIAIADDDHLGRFSLRSNQVAPYNIFISNSLLWEKLDIYGLSNAILISDPKQIGADNFNATFEKTWQLKDAGLDLKKLDEQGNYEITSDRIFIDKQISDSILDRESGVQTILSYLVNTIRHKTNNTPYSFVTAVSDNFYGEEIKDQEIIINQWLADDLSAAIGDTIELTYFIIDPLQNLKENSSSFIVKEIIPTKNDLIDRSLMPRFPGFAKAVSCMEWNSNIPVDMDRIRDKDEAYWNEFRGTPKAVISIRAGQQLWQNKFGDYTAIRFNDSIFTTASSGKQVEPEILKKFSPGDLNLNFIDVKLSGIEASQNGVDFGQLFLALSFFVILSGLILTGMLYVLSLQKREAETGILISLGFTGKDILKYRVLENVILIITGSVLGVLVGIIYNYGLLMAVNSVWNDILRTSMMHVSIQPLTLFSGFISSVVLSFLVIFFITIKSYKRSAVSLINGGNQSIHPVKPKRMNSRISSLTGLAIHNVFRNRVRSLTTIILLALGVFVLILTGANRKTVSENDSDNSSGTGGYDLWAESTVPFNYDINTAEGREKLGFQDDAALKNLTFYPMLSLEGNDASCLNLNQVSSPTIIGINPTVFDERNSFSFDQLADHVDKIKPWPGLDISYGNNVIPGYADQTVITWGLMKSVGDTLLYTNEFGEDLRIVLTGGLSASVFQGNLLISESNFKKHFPSINTSRLMLIDMQETKKSEIANQLSQYLQDYGIDISSTSERLNQFNSVSNTYLSVFMILGGLGLLIGTIGMGIILYRNMLERRQEIAVLMAIGFTRKKIRYLFFAENLILLTTGIVSGILTAVMALIPSFMSPTYTLPESYLFVIIILIYIHALCWIYFPLRKALDKNIIIALRKE